MENNIYLLQGSPSISGQGGGGGMVAARLLKFSPDGKLLWNVPVSSGNNVVRSLGLDQDSNAYVLGQYEEHGYYLSKWNSSGKHAWTCNGPSRAADIVDHLSVSKKGVLFVGGQTDGSNRRASAFVAKHDEHGSLLWRRDLSQVNQIAGLASDGVSVYVSGRVQQSDQKMYLLRIQ